MTPSVAMDRSRVDSTLPHALKSDAREVRVVARGKLPTKMVRDSASLVGSITLAGSVTAVSVRAVVSVDDSARFRFFLEGSVCSLRTLRLGGGGSC